MKMCFYEDKNVSSKIVSSLFNHRKTGKYCDLTVKLGELQLRVHGCVVSIFSRVIEKFMSNSEVIQAPDRTLSVSLNLRRFSCVECATKVIEFMYIGKIQIDFLHLEHIRSVSESLQVSELLKICKQYLDKCPVPDDADSEGLHDGTSDCANELILSPPCTNEAPLPKMCSSMDRVLTCDTGVNLFNHTSENDDPIDEGEWSGMKCPKCDLVLMSTAKYQQHCSTHLGKTFTTCCVCNYASIRVFDVIKHLQETDHNENVCSICLLQFNSNRSFKEHLSMHDQSQPFFCLTCNTRFQTRTALNSHIVRHTNETPFVCKECGRGFKWKHGLQSHMVTHSKLKSFLCDQCGFSTAHLRSFIDHKTIHSGEKFKCPKPDCQFSSVRKESVKHHLMTHSKQKPYQCEVCGQAFSQSKNLRRHAISHNPSADPEKCPFCPYQTSRSDKFKAHFKRYHKDGSHNKEFLKKTKESSICLSGVPENVKETARTLAALSTCLLSTSDNTSCNQPSDTSKRRDTIILPNKKGCEKVMVGRRSSLIPVDSVPSYVEDVFKNVNHNPGKKMVQSTYDSACDSSKDESTLCACNLQSSHPSTILQGHPNDEFSVTAPCLKKDATERPSSVNVNTVSAVHVIEQSNPKHLAGNFSKSEAERHTSSSCREIIYGDVKSALETEEVIVNCEEQGNLLKASTSVTESAENCDLCPPSDFSHTDHLVMLKVNAETDTKIKDSLVSAFPSTIPFTAYPEVSVNDNVLLLSSEDKLLQHFELPDTADENVIVLNAEETISSSSSETVYVIPDGTFIIMDEVCIS